MTGYDYTDSGGRVLHVHPFLPGPAMEIAAPKGTVHVGPEEASALALAILEAAGHSDGETENPDRAPESDAVWHLRKALRHRTEQAEREAEDAKLAQYCAHRMKVIGVRNPTPWAEMPETQRQAWRDEYRAAKEFFSREQALDEEARP